MAGVGIDDFGASFNFYLPKYAKTLNEVSKIRNIPLGNIKWEGVQVVKKVHVKRNSGITATTDGGHIPAAGKQSYVEAMGTRKFVTGSVQVTDGILANAKTTKHAAVSVVKSELNGLLDNIRTFENFFFSRDGTGQVALLGSTTFGTTFTVNDARGLWDGQDYEIRDATTPTTIHRAFEVSSVARALTSGEATVTPTASLASGNQALNDLIIWKSGVDSAYGNMITGLDSLIDDTATTFQNVNVSTYPRYSSVVLDNGGSTQTLTPSLLRNMLASLAQEQAEESVGKLMVYTSVWDNKNFEEMFEGELRIAPDTRVGGIKVPAFQSAFGQFSIMTDPHMEYGKMFFIDRSQISRLSQKELSWRPGTNGIFNTVNNNLSYVATCVEIADYFIEDRRTSGKLDNLAVSVQTAY